MSTRRKVMWIGISIAAFYVVFLFITWGAPKIFGFRMLATDAKRMGELAGRLTGIIILLGLIWIFLFRPKSNK